MLLLPLQLAFSCFGGVEIGLTDKNLDIITYAVSLIIKAVIMAT